ncbi:MAG: efflux RND transporter periplasmic adaptor subunit [Winogradskyella sp.]|uniref:efflux RND transporter periplasmic adaptor subunit n=1 Tax=Winogradskyella sp. TaxID=1883156 RepID=UPI0025CC7059|nr:efflux RND transporter periplasmic adaptor subunit [Winogradskyella sp.]NRB59454.1 efflux RND transporter periplasmic adaptor subunit [Winogradskyella sp.]
MKYKYLLIFLYFLACGSNEEKKSSTSNKNIENTNITVSKTTFQSQKMKLDSLREYVFSKTIEINGMIDVPPKNKAIITSFVGGYVSHSPLLVGDKVQKGQHLISLKNPEFIEMQQHYLEISEQLNFLKNEFERQQALYNENISSKKNYLKAESNYKSRLATYNGLRKKLQLMNINPLTVEQGKLTSTIHLYAPIDGNVTQLKISNGSFVEPNDIILEIINTDHIHIELLAFEKDIMRIKKGQQIQFKIPEASNETYNAIVHLVGTTIDKNTRRVQVHGHVNTEKTKFLVGMYVEAKILVEPRIAFGISNEAITNINDKNYVLTLEKHHKENYSFIKTEVEIGQQNKDFVEILNVNVVDHKSILVEGVNTILEGGKD